MYENNPNIPETLYVIMFQKNQIKVMRQNNHDRKFFLK